MYAVVDVETTGGKYGEEGITEIAIYQYDGHELTDQLISLINPCLLYTSPSPRDRSLSRMPSSA